jgi:hypothetical protein
VNEASEINSRVPRRRAREEKESMTVSRS